MSSQRQTLRQFVRNTFVISVTVTAAVLTALPLQAAVFDELIVTAQKREQNIQDVSISVSGFTGDQMRVLGIQDSFDIAMFIPNVNISGNLAGQNTQFSIRGVTQNDFNDIIEAPVAVYLDEGYIPIAQGQTFTLFDVERVEVLKGPQSTLFGRNATGGVVQYISKKPSFDGMEAYVDATYGQYDTSADPNYSKFEAAISGPITKTLAGRLSALYDKRDPYLENLFRNDTVNVNDANRFGGGTFVGDNSFTANASGADAGADLGETETWAVRGILEFDPSESLRFTLMANYANSDLATGPYQSKPTIGIYDGTLAGLDTTIPIPGGDPGGQLSQGELLNVIDVAPNESRLSICAPGGVDNGEDCGADANNDATPDDLRGFGLDQGRLSNIFALTPGGDFFGYKDPDGKDWTFSGDFAFKDSGNQETTGLQLRVEWDFADMTLTSISDYKDFEKLLFIDVDAAPVNQAANYAGVDADSFSQELRVNGVTENLNWVAGLYYLHIDTDSDNGLKFPVNSIAVGAGGPFDLGSDAQLQTDSYSLFGQVDWAIADKVTLIGGLRVIQEEKDYRFEQSLYFGNNNSRVVHQGFRCSIGPGFDPGAADPTCPGAAFDDSTSDTLWAGKLQLDFRPNDDWLLYAGLNRGVKAGSFNAQLAGGLPVPLAAIPYDDETLHSIETGFKSTWFSGTTRINGTFFYYDYNDYQAFLFGGVSGIVINQDAETFGVEFEVQTTPIEGLDAMLSIGWFDATVEDVPLRAEAPSDNGAAPCTPASPVVCKDVEPVYAPSTQVAGVLRYEWAIGPGRMSVQGDFSWSDSFYYNLRNFDADQFDDYTLVNAVVGWVSPEEHWAVNLAARNLTDENAGIQGFDLATLCGCNEISFRAPRRYEVNVNFSF